MEYSLSSVRDMGAILPFSADEAAASAPAITSVSSLDVCLSVDGKIYVCPVWLDRKGTAGFSAPDGKLIYIDDTIEVRLHGTTQGISTWYGDKTSLWYLWVVNRTEEPLTLFFNASDVTAQFSSFMSEIIPHGTVFLCVSGNPADGENLSVTFEQDAWFNAGAYRSEPVMLPAE